MDGTTNGSNGTANDKGTDLTQRNYIRWDAEGVEKIPPNEEEDVKTVAEQINCIQRATFNKGRHCFGGIKREDDINQPSLTLLHRHTRPHPRHRKRAIHRPIRPAPAPKAV
jgi:hypothetical protein